VVVAEGVGGPAADTDVAFEPTSLDHPHLAAWRDAFREFGVKPKRAVCSAEALIARGGEPFDGGDPPRPGEVVWADREGVTCRRWNWRQCVRTRLTESTAGAYFVFDALAVSPDSRWGRRCTSSRRCCAPAGLTPSFPRSSWRGERQLRLGGEATKWRVAAHPPTQSRVCRRMADKLAIREVLPSAGSNSRLGPPNASESASLHARRTHALRTAVRIRIIRIRMKCAGTITVPLPPEQALALFTPEGERAWAPGWDPQYHSDTVFTTAHGDAETIWVALETGVADSVRYARVTPGAHAGTVEVRCHADGTAHVTYDLTPLSPGALDHFASRYETMLAEWERRIAAACMTSR
jgi:hypothetical protein